MRDFWMRGYRGFAQPTVPNNPSISVFSASAVFQTVMHVNGWADDAHASPVIRQLKAASPDRLSIRLMTTAFRAYTIPGTALMAGQGFLMGVIGPYREGEPREFIANRRMRTVADTPYPFNLTSCAIDPVKKTLVVDLGNSGPGQIASWTTPMPFDVVDAVILKQTDGSDQILRSM